MNTKTKMIALCALLAIGTPALANENADILEGYIGKTKEEISATLKDKGYEVRKVEPEDGYLEAYALKDGKKYEIYIDPKSGNFAKSKVD